MNAGLQMVGQHHGQPRVWTVTAWAMLPDGTKEKLVVRPQGKVQLRDLISLINTELAKFEEEHGVGTVDAGFQATAR